MSKGGSRPLALSFFKKGVIVVVVISLVVFVVNLIAATYCLTVAIVAIESPMADAWIIAIFVGVATLNLVSAIIMAMVAKEGFEKRKG